MPQVPLLRPAEVVGVFEKLGWRVVRRRGSHIILTKTGSVATLSVPDHPQVARGTLQALIARSGATVEAFLQILDE
jgi:predicted RNA binding protein YcfA (HicA-like mRNA interferase family)